MIAEPQRSPEKWLSFEPSAMEQVPAAEGVFILADADKKPAVIKGVESQGMLLAASTGQGYALIVPDKDMKAGVRVE